MSTNPRSSTLAPSTAFISAGGGETITLETPQRGTTSRHKNTAVIVGRGPTKEVAKAPLRFAMIEELGSGGMGVVMRARDPDLHREVAIKLLRQHEDPVRRARFLAEAQITGQLEHPNIIPIHEFGRDADDRPWFSMKQVVGRDLAVILALRKQDQAMAKDWPLTRLVDVLIQVCNAAAFAHSRGVIHRDLKPANVMIGGFGEVLVMDWGLGKVLDGSVTEIAVTPQEGQASPLVTLDGAVIGTPCYMAPEQARGELDRMGMRSDVYSLGALLSEIITGRPPILGDTAEDVVLRASQGRIDLPLVDWEGKPTPKELIAVTRRAMALDPDQRYPSAEALARDLRLWQENRVVSAMGLSVVDIASKFLFRHKVAAGTTLAVAALLGGGLVLSYQAKEEQRRQAIAAQQVAESLRARAEEALRQWEEQRRQTESGRKREQVLINRSERQGRHLDRSLALAILGQADAAIARNRPADALRLLDQVPGEERDWTWGHLRIEAAGSGRVEISVGDSVFVGGAGDGFVAVERSGRLRWLSAQGGERQSQSTSLGKSVASARTDAEGRLLAVSLVGGGLRLFDTATGRSLANQVGVEPAAALAIANEGRLVLSAVSGGVRWFGLGGKTAPGERPLPGVTAVATAPDRGWWAAATAAGIAVRNEDGSDRRLETPSAATSLHASRDGRMLAATCAGVVRLWSMPGGTLLTDLPSGPRTTALAVGPGNLVACGDSDGTTALWDVETGLVALRLPGTAPVIALAWSVGGRDLAVLHADGQLSLLGN